MKLLAGLAMQVFWLDHAALIKALLHTGCLDSLSIYVVHSDSQGDPAAEYSTG